MNILEKIFAHKREEVAAAKEARPLKLVEQDALNAPIPADFIAALRNRSRPAPRLIAEVKHRSPSKGLLSKDFDPLRLALAYAKNGAAAISVLTDEQFFGGSLDYLRQIAALGLDTPLLRKDFIFDEYQLLEARASGASAALLIVAMLDDLVIKDLLRFARNLGLAPLVEVHSHPELDRAMDAGATLIGINNRDLKTFNVSLETTLELRQYIPDDVTLVAESGIHTQGDVAKLAKAGVHAMLVGESIVVADDVAAKVRELANFAPHPSPLPEGERGLSLLSQGRRLG